MNRDLQRRSRTLSLSHSLSVDFKDPFHSLDNAATFAANFVRCEYRFLEGSLEFQRDHSIIPYPTVITGERV